MFPVISSSDDFPFVGIESILDGRSITLKIVAADARAAANDSENGAVLAILSAPTINPKKVYVKYKQERSIDEH